MDPTHGRVFTLLCPGGEQLKTLKTKFLIEIQNLRASVFFIA